MADYSPPFSKPKTKLKIRNTILSFSVVTLAVWAAGCKQESNTAAKEDPAKTESQATDAVNKTVETAKEAGAQVVADVKTAGAQTVEKASAKAQELIDSAKRLFNEGKFADALAQLNQTTNASPSTEQQSVVASLKTQIEKAIAAAAKATTDATKSATNALNNFLQK